MMNLENLLKKHNKFISLLLVSLVLIIFILSVFGKIDFIVFWGVALVAFVYIKLSQKYLKK